MIRTLSPTFFSALTALVISGLVGAQSAHGAGVVKITRANRSEFTYLGERYACRDTNGERQLGAVNKAPLKVGCRWAPVSAESRRSALLSKVVGAQRKLVSASSTASRRKLSAKVDLAQKRLAGFESALAQCSPPVTPLPPAPETPAIEPTPPLAPDPTPAPLPTPPAGPQSYTVPGTGFVGRITGVTPANAIATLGGDTVLLNADASSGTFAFSDLAPGEYFLKVEAPGVNFHSVKSVAVKGDPLAPPSELTYDGQAVSHNVFRYHWQEENGAYSGSEYSAYVNTPPQLEVLGTQLEPVDAGAAEILISEYKVYLSNEQATWTQETADRLYKTFQSLGFVTVLPKSKWLLVDTQLADDIQIRPLADGLEVTVSKAAFANATPVVVNLNGERGRYFSKRLHHAVVRYVTANGTNRNAVDNILESQFGLTLYVYDHEALTRETTHESWSSFQAFRSEEILEIITMLEELPEGYHRVEGLRYLLRRKAGMSNPRCPDAAVLVYPEAAEKSYMEFTDLAFAKPQNTPRLIVSGISTFLYVRTFPQALKDEWKTLGGWHRDELNPGRWLTTKDTQLVSPAAALGPREDMAESLAFYLTNPDWLMSRSPDKSAFIKERVMHGSRYLSAFRDDLTFQVFNLFPDYVYPGKIKRVDVTVSGAPDADKEVVAELELHTRDNFYEGAAGATALIYGPSSRSYAYAMFAPVNPDANGLASVLRARFTVTKFAERGQWSARYIFTYDRAGNMRMQGQDSFGWRMYIDNSLEDLTPPAYVPNSLRLSAAPKVIEGHLVTELTATWQIEENIALRPWGVVAFASHTDPEAGALYAWGEYDEATKRATARFIVTEFRRSGLYGVCELVMIDLAGNETRYWFDDNPKPGREAVTRVAVESANPDIERPEVDLNAIAVRAEPTHPEAPNGETMVTVNLFARDNLSGVGAISVAIRGPQGVSYAFGMSHENVANLFYQGDPTTWKEYSGKMMLPAGSAPGTWGIVAIVVYDHAGNYRFYDLTETIHFEVTTD